MIEVRELVKRYGKTTALDGISFKVKSGDVVGFLGPNGAGKTTTMRILTTFLTPNQGEVYVKDIDALVEPLEVRKIIGYLPEEPPLYKDMEVIKYLEFVGKLKGVENLSDSIDRVVEETGIKEYLNTQIKHLSKGYRQRVGIAQALINDPEVLILDEPTSGLDPNQIVEIRGLIKSLSGNRTVIISSHILHEVSQTCRSVIIIDKGKIIASGDMEELRKKMMENMRIEIVFSGDRKEALVKLESIDEVLNIEEAKGGYDEYFSFLVEVKGDYDVLDRILRKLVEANVKIYKYSPVELTLEDIFRYLTSV